MATCPSRHGNSTTTSITKRCRTLNRTSTALTTTTRENKVMIVATTDRPARLAVAIPAIEANKMDTNPRNSVAVAVRVVATTQTATKTNESTRFTLEASHAVLRAQT